MEVHAHICRDDKKNRERGKNAIDSMLVLFFYPSKGDDGHLFFSSRRRIEEEKKSQKKCSCRLHLTRWMYACSLASHNTGEKE